MIARYKGKITNRKTAMRAHCIECSCGVVSEVNKCPVVKCALWPFRLGTDPFNKKTASNLAARAEEVEEE